MKKIFLFFILICFLFVGCKTTKDAGEVLPPESQTESTEQVEIEEVPPVDENLDEIITEQGDLPLPFDQDFDSETDEFASEDEFFYGDDFVPENQFPENTEVEVENEPELVVSDGFIGEDDLALGTTLTNQVTVVLHIVHQGEGMQVLAEELTVTLQSQNIGVGIDLGFVQLVQGNQLIAHLVGGVAQHQNDLLAAAGNTAQADSKTVTGQDGENNTHGFTAQLGADILGNGIHGCVVTLSTGHDGLGQCHNVTVADLIAFACCSFQHAAYGDLNQIVTLTDDGAANASGNGSDFSFHNDTSFPRPGHACGRW